MPKGVAWPLRRKLLGKALTAAGVSKLLPVKYDYSAPEPESTIVLHALFFAEGSRIVSVAGRTQVSIYPVLKRDRLAVEEALISEILPKLADWLRDAEQADGAWRGSNHSFCVFWSNATMSSVSD
jgi:hypothetical protein